MKKLIPALCMLLVAAALLGTSTYAWFSMNTEVKATNMSVTAVANKNLLISQTSADAGFAGIQNMSANLATCVPVSCYGGNKATPAFFKMLNAGTGMTQDSSVATEGTTFEAAIANTHYLKESVWVKNVGGAATNLIATVSVTSGGEAALDPSLRVMLVVEEKTYIYQPVSGAGYNDSGKAISAIDGDGKPTLTAVSTIATSGSQVVLASLSAETAYQVDIYIWYEGEDPACKAANTLDLATTTFDIAFSVTHS